MKVPPTTFAHAPPSTVTASSRPSWPSLKPRKRWTSSAATAHDPQKNPSSTNAARTAATVAAYHTLDLTQILEWHSILNVIQTLTGKRERNRVARHRAYLRRGAADRHRRRPPRGHDAAPGRRARLRRRHRLHVLPVQERAHRRGPARGHRAAHRQLPRDARPARRGLARRRGGRRSHPRGRHRPVLDRHQPHVPAGNSSAPTTHVAGRSSHDRRGRTAGGARRPRPPRPGPQRFAAASRPGALSAPATPWPAPSRLPAASTASSKWAGSAASTPDLLDGERLAGALVDDLLPGWGADVGALAAAHAHVDDPRCLGPVGPPDHGARSQ